MIYIILKEWQCMLCTSARNASHSELLDTLWGRKSRKLCRLVSIEELIGNSWCSYPFIVSSLIPLGLLRVRGRRRGGGRQTPLQIPPQSRKPDVLKSCLYCKHAYVPMNSMLGAIFLVLSDDDFFSPVYLFFPGWVSG